MKYLILATDAYGGHGGIAQYGRDVIEALCSNPATTRVVALARSASRAPGAMPAKLENHIVRWFGRFGFALAALWHGLRNRDVAVIYCTHINLAPAAWCVSRLIGKPWALTIHGIDAWESRENAYRRYFAGRADLVISVSGVTLERFRSWCPVPDHRTFILPNAVHPEAMGGDGPRNPELVRRYGLAGKAVILTLGRLVSFDRHKGFDVVLDAMPALLAERPDLVYLIAGDGPDRARLEAKALALGITDHVVFAGDVAEHEKADHFRLADVFAMLSKGEGFGIVLLEALACGTPIIASRADGSREAALDGKVGEVVDPDNKPELTASILRGLSRPRGVPADLDHFAFPRFAERVHRAIGMLTS